MNLIGKTSINPIFFYTGKISGYILWIIFVLSIFNIINISYSIIILKYLSYLICFFGIVFTFLSLINLGKSTRLGLPKEKTSLKNNGIYKISRNPMYIGFDLFTISSMLYTLNIYLIFIGLYSIIIYHFIIIGEEQFLENRFGNVYINYKKRVKRYF